MRTYIPIRRLTLLLAALLATLAVPAAAQTPPTSFSYRWEASDSGIPRSDGLGSFARDPVETSTLYGLTRRGTFKSVNNGRSWFRVNNELNAIDIAVDPSDPAIVYVVGMYGVIKTTDGGVTWSRKNQGLPDHTHPGAIAITPTEPNVLYSGLSSSYSSPPDGGVYRSTDGAETWSYLGLEGQIPYEILVHPNNPDIIYVAGTRGLHTSYDGGEHWSERNPDLPTYVASLAMDPHDPDVMYAGTSTSISDPAGIYKSVNAGVSWSLVATAAGGLPVAAVADISIDPEWPNTVYVAAAYDVFASLDGGASWHTLDFPGNSLDSVIYDPEESGRGVLVGVWDFDYRPQAYRGLRLDARQFLPLMLR